MILWFDLQQAAVRLGCGLLFAVLCAASGGHAQEASPSIADLLPRATITSSDNAFEISAVPARLGYRGPVLFFANQFRAAFLRMTRLEFKRIEHPITIRLGSSTNDLRVLQSCAMAIDGVAREWIDIPDPEHVDLDWLRVVLAHALVREWQRALPAAHEHRQPVVPPEWLLAGAARLIGAGHQVEDLDDVHAQWLRGRLPPLAELLSADPPAVLQYPAMQAVLVAWLLDRSGDSFGMLLRRLAEGTTWSPALVAETVHAERNMAGLNEEWDAWQANAMREIRQVGVTTPGMVRAFCAQLQVYPGDYGLPVADAWRGRTFAECLAWPATPEVKFVLRNKAMEVRVFSAGRDGALQHVAMAYATVLDALAAGTDPSQVRNLLAQAEEGRRLLEARAAKGEILHDPVSETHLPSEEVRKMRRLSP